MDLPFILVIGLILAVLFFKARMDSRWLASPHHRYQRVFSAASAGLLLFVSGTIGWDLRNSHGWFNGTKWVNGPVWWEVVGGLALLLLAAFWVRRVDPAVGRQRASDQR